MPPRRSTPMSDAHKAALAAGRSQGAAVRRYLEALESSKPRRGRRPDPESLRKQLGEIDAKIASAEPLQRLHLVQQKKDLEARLNAPQSGTDLAKLEAEFVKVASEYGSKKGIAYSTWREMGVPADTLRRAGISRAS